MAIIDVIIPAFNEEGSIQKVIDDIPKALVRDIIVVNNNSTDQTSLNASSGGDVVLHEERKGYGWACLTGLAYLAKNRIQPDIVVFLDADYSDHPDEMGKVVKPILAQGMDMVIGSRALGDSEAGSMTGTQIFGNWLSSRLMRIFYRARFTDLGPFRAIRYPALMALEMQDKTFGWTVEMQIKAVKKKYRYTEVPVTYRKRIGVSKVSGTLKGSILAGIRIIYLIFKYI